MYTPSFKQRLLSGAMVLGLAMGVTATLAPAKVTAGRLQAELYSEVRCLACTPARMCGLLPIGRCSDRAHRAGFDAGALVQTQTDVPNFLFMLNHPNQVFHQTVTCTAQSNTRMKCSSCPANSRHPAAPGNSPGGCWRGRRVVVAQVLGLTIPQHVLLQVTEIIQ